MAEPDEKLTVMLVPRSADVPAPGSEETAWPASIVSEETSSPLTKTRPALSMALLASDCDMPDTSGTTAAVAVAVGVDVAPPLPPGSLFEKIMPMAMPSRMRRARARSHTHQRRRGVSSTVSSGVVDCGTGAGGAGAEGDGEGAAGEFITEVPCCQLSVAGAATANPREAARRSARMWAASW